MSVLSARIMPRSFLYVPADRPDLFPKAAAGIADALIFDLEDAVPSFRKQQARADLHDWLVANPPAAHGASAPQQVWVRVSAETMIDDLDAVVVPGVSGIMQAKCSQANLIRLAEELSRLENLRNLERSMIGTIGLVEDAQALQQLSTMATVDRLVTFAVGEVDLMADLRMTRSAASESALDTIRTHVVIACAAAKLSAPIAPTSTAILETREFEISSYKMRDLGFRSRTAIHPSQLAIIHHVFTPGPEAVDSARDVIERFEAAQGGVALDVDGRMIDAAVVRGARETLLRSPAAGPGSQDSV